MAEEFERQLLRAAEERWSAGDTPLDYAVVYVTPFQNVDIRWVFVDEDGDEVELP